MTSRDAWRITEGSARGFLLTRLVSTARGTALASFSPFFSGYLDEIDGCLQCSTTVREAGYGRLVGANGQWHSLPLLPPFFLSSVLPLASPEEER